VRAVQSRWRADHDHVHGDVEESIEVIEGRRAARLRNRLGALARRTVDGNEASVGNGGKRPRVSRADIPGTNQTDANLDSPRRELTIGAASVTTV